MTNNWLSESDFTQAVSCLPLVSVDLLVLNPNGEMLLGLRRNAPARDWWFTPGARVRKNEPVTDALRRVLSTELGLPSDLAPSARLMGVWDHHYPDSAFCAQTSTHYVNLPHLLQLHQPLDLASLPTDQHSQWRWQAPAQASIASDVHPYVHPYAQLAALTTL